jgi:hypothetical protein
MFCNEEEFVVLKQLQVKDFACKEVLLFIYQLVVLELKDHEETLFVLASSVLACECDESGVLFFIFPYTRS